MKIRWLGERVLLEVLPDPSHALDAGDSPTAIVIPEAYRRFSRRGRVLAVGPGWHTRSGAFVPTELEPGMVAVIPVDKGLVLQIGGREHRVIDERDLLGVDEAA